MRIVGHIEHPDLKITLFKMDNKYSIKFERGLFEQTYKFREGNIIQSIGDVRNLVDPVFLDNVLRILKEMEKTSQGALDKLQTDITSEFDDII